MQERSPIDIRREKAKKIYDKYVDEGFKVRNVSRFYENNDAAQKRYETIISTPWVSEDKGINNYTPVNAYVLSVFPPERGDDYASLGETEVLDIQYFFERKNEDDKIITSLLEKGKNHLYDVNTKANIDKNVADKTITDIIQVANNLPHVVMWDEFIPLEMVISKRNGEDFDVDVSTSDYINDYLSSVEDSLLKIKNGFFIGKITSHRDIHYAYESIPKEDREIMMVEKAGCTVEEYLKKIM